MIRLLGTAAVVYGIALAVIGQDLPTGLFVVLVGWLIRRATRPDLTRRYGWRL